MVAGHHRHRDGGGPAAVVRHAPHACSLSHSKKPATKAEIQVIYYTVLVDHPPLKFVFLLLFLKNARTSSVW